MKRIKLDKKALASFEKFSGAEPSRPYVSIGKKGVLYFSFPIPSDKGVELYFSRELCTIGMRLLPPENNPTVRRVSNKRYLRIQGFLSFYKLNDVCGKKYEVYSADGTDLWFVKLQEPIGNMRKYVKKKKGLL